MNTRWTWIGILALAVLLSGCYTTGLSVRENSHANYTSYLYALYDGHFSDQEIQQSRATPKRVNLPATLAVAQVGEVAPPQAMIEQLARDRALFSAVQGIPAVRDPNATRPPEVSLKEEVRDQVRQMRRFAADLGMDYLFLYGGTIDVGETATGATILDWTIIGAYVPTHKVHAVGRASGALVDIATGQVLFMVTAEDELKTYESTMARSYGTSDAYLTQVRESLIPKLTEALLAKVQERAAH